jgi:hypothetical protein
LQSAGARVSPGLAVRQEVEEPQEAWAGLSLGAESLSGALPDRRERWVVAWALPGAPPGPAAPSPGQEPQPAFRPPVPRKSRD